MLSREMWKKLEIRDFAPQCQQQRRDVPAPRPYKYRVYTEAERLDIIDRYHQGERLASIALTFGVSPQSVHRFVMRHSKTRAALKRDGAA